MSVKFGLQSVFPRPRHLDSRDVWLHFTIPVMSAIGPAVEVKSTGTLTLKLKFKLNEVCALRGCCGKLTSHTRTDQYNARVHSIDRFERFSSLVINKSFSSEIIYLFIYFESPYQIMWLSQSDWETLSDTDADSGLTLAKNQVTDTVKSSRILCHPMRAIADNAYNIICRKYIGRSKKLIGNRNEMIDRSMKTSFIGNSKFYYDR